MYFVEKGVPKYCCIFFSFDRKLEFFNNNLCKEY